MNLNYLDWTIIGVAIVALRLFSLSTRQYMHGVADFLSANRSAGRYLLTIATQMGSVGVVTFVGAFEMIYSAGLPPRWWELMGIPGGGIILLTGWVYYRFRETRAMTMAQFFEMRYSRRFRIFAGILCWTSGILNFGIFPAVAARFIIYFCGLPETFSVPGDPCSSCCTAPALPGSCRSSVSLRSSTGRPQICGSAGCSASRRTAPSSLRVAPAPGNTPSTSGA